MKYACPECKTDEIRNISMEGEIECLKCGCIADCKYFEVTEDE